MMLILATLLAASSDPSSNDVAQPPKPKDLSPLMGDNYPAAAYRVQAEGRTAVTVDVDPKGRVSACRVTATSGNADLDRTTCDLFRKLRFYPATDRNGKPVIGQWASSMKWTMAR